MPTPNARATRARLATWISLTALLYPLAAASAQTSLDFYTITPCRVYDSRWGAGPMVGGFDRLVPIGGSCGVPPDAASVAINLTAVSPNATASMTAYPTGAATNTNVVSFSAGVTRASNAAIKLSAAGQMSVLMPAPFSTGADVVVDISGYFRAQAPVQQWRGWERTILSTVDYTANGGDPYSEVELRIRLTNTSTGSGFIQDAFWDDDPTQPRAFKFRTAVPAGNWAWQVESCSRNGLNCLADGWAPSSGTITVQSDTANPNPLYSRGFPTQIETVSGGETTALSDLLYPDGEVFQWIGDTAWVAPPREFDPPGGTAAQTSNWLAYVQDRQSKGYTGVQIAPALTWSANAWRPALPAAMGFSFKSKAGCNEPFVNCTTMTREYKSHLSAMIKQANDHGLVVAILGMMNPTGIPRANPYPSSARAITFAKDLAATLKNRAVIYSPSFDDFAEDHANPAPAPPDPGRRALINAVGKALRAKLQTFGSAIRKDILTNHLAGGEANCDQYRSFASVPAAQRWLSFHFFQSGHGGTGGTTTGNCPGHVAGATDLQNAMRRPREMSLNLSKAGSDFSPPLDDSPRLPAVNAEGPYDRTDTTPGGHPNVDNRFRIRHAAYMTALSDGAGFTYGADLLWGWVWTAPHLGTELDSAGDMLRFSNHLKGLALDAHHDWILNQPPSTPEQKKMVLATAGTDLILAYLPGASGSSDSIAIDTAAGGIDLACADSPWTWTWFDPASGIVPGGSCAQGADTVTLERPPCSVTSTQDCDRLIKIQRSSEKGGFLEAAAPRTELFDVWEAPLEGTRTTGIYAARRVAGGSETVVLAPAGRAHQRSPRLDRLGPNHLAVFQADGLDGSLSGVFATIFSEEGRVLAGPLPVNTYTEGDQREPAVAASRSGEALVVWASDGQGRAEIRGRILRPSSDLEFGDPRGEETVLSEPGAGRVQSPRVAAFPGGYWVAWEVLDDNGQVSSFRLRHLLASGRPVGNERELRLPPREQGRLLPLDSASPAGVRARWWRLDERGRFLGLSPGIMVEGRQ
jgi:hypothetical protein